MAILKKFIKNISLVSIANATIALKGLILIPIITKNLGTSNYGIWAQIIVTFYLIIPIATLNLEKGLIRFTSSKTDKKEIGREFSTILIVVLFWSILISGLFVGGLKFTIMFYQDLAIFEDYILLIALVLPLWSLNLILMSYLRSRLQFAHFTSFIISHHVIDVVLIGSFITIGWGIQGALVAMLVNMTVINLILFSIIFKQIGFQKPDYSIISKYLAFSVPIVPLELFWWVADSSDKYITGYFLGLSAVGVYAAVYAMSRIVNMVTIPLNLILGPTLVKHYDNGEIDEVKKLLWFSLKIFFTIALPTIIGFTILAQPLLLILATQEFSEKGAILVPLICTGVLFYGIESILGNIFHLAKKTYVAGLIWGSAAVMNIVFNFILIPLVGIIGAAVSTILTFGITTVIIIAYTMQHVRIPVDWWYILKSYSAAVLMGLGLLILFLNIPVNFITTVIMIAFGIGVYFGLLMAIKGFNQEEIDFVKSILKVK